VIVNRVSPPKTHWISAMGGAAMSGGGSLRPCLEANMTFDFRQGSVLLI
jgi:hypothetical protein